MIKKTLILFLLLFCMKEGKAQFTLPLPQGWTNGETKSPIKKVPALPAPFKGVQAYRFPPDYLDTASINYNSFLILWYIDGIVDFKTNILEDDIDAYFTNIYRFNAGPQFSAYRANEQSYKGKVTLNLEPQRKKDANEAIYQGDIVNLNYLTGRNDRVLARVHVLHYGDGINSHTAVFIETSYVDYSQTVWIGMESIISGFKVGR